MSKTEETVENMSVEELVALGFDRATAESMCKYSGAESGSGIFAPIMSFNYDKDDVLGDTGAAKKGEFISGYKINRRLLTLEEEGTNYGNEIEFIVFGSVYQYSAYDSAKNTTSVASNIFTTPFDAKKAVDLKSGKLITDLKKTNDKIKFANILGVLVKTGDGWAPHAFYSRGTNAYQVNEQLETQFSMDTKDLPNAYRVRTKSKKVPTKGNPAWVMDIQDVERLTVSELVALKDVLAPNIKKFDDWVNSVNNTNKSASESSDTPTGTTDVDDEITFDE